MKVHSIFMLLLNTVPCANVFHFHFDKILAQAFLKGCLYIMLCFSIDSRVWF